MKYRRTTFAEIKHLLPADCWAAWRNELHQGEFDQEPVGVFEQDTELASLNLDFDPANSDYLFLLLVKGNLTVKSFIYNEETDGATGLVVLGNLHARTVLVGGQEIYVTGNLTVEELFWGDYNHGSLRVLGTATATVFAETDQYSVAIEQATRFGTHLTPYGEDGRWRGLDAGLVAQVLVAELVNTNADGETHLVRGGAVLQLLQARQSLLRHPAGSGYPGVSHAHGVLMDELGLTTGEVKMLRKRVG
ncbi:MAG: hypothetical protein EOO62_39280 [Hymenobacter sp.]|nr:MAG: hypothetical protein EOO62_39280 [Hymenobacter sp.]